MKKITNSGYIMSNSVNYKAFLIQTLVHNYLYDKYKDKVDNVWLYDEIVQNNPLPDDIIHDKQNKLTMSRFLRFWTLMI